MLDSNGSNVPNVAKPSKSSGRKVLMMLGVIFLLPFTVAATLHYLDLRPSGKSYGELVQPPVALKVPTVQSLQGKPFASAKWLKIWSVVTIDANGCLEACHAQLHIIKQVHTSLNKEIKRIQRVLLVPHDADADAFKSLQATYPDLVVLKDDASASLTAQFQASNNKPASIYLVDPLGNLMMIYDQKMNPKGLRSDLSRLLKNSWAG